MKFKIRKKKKIHKRMDDIKKYLNEFSWYSEDNISLSNRIPKPIITPEYASTFQNHFGLLPVVFLTVSGKVLPVVNFKSFEKYILSIGFDIEERGLTSFKYVHYENKIILNGEVTVESKDDDDDDDDDDGYPTTISSSDAEYIYISILPTLENKEFIEKALKKIQKYLLDVSDQVDKFYLIAEGQQGLFTQKTKFKSIPIKDERYDLFYGDDFPHEKLQQFVSGVTENLMLLHGDPGTGKSNYIKHIITNSKRKVIYIPPSMLSVISSPGFVSFMMKNKGSIILIEDAEEVLSIDRNSATNNLLGLTDGFLKDCLDLKIIATFNTDIGKIDPALLRKGRMFYEYRFKSLTVDEGNRLLDYMGQTRRINEPMTLAEIFNAEDNHADNSFEERRIGFL